MLCFIKQNNLTVITCKTNSYFNLIIKFLQHKLRCQKRMETFELPTAELLQINRDLISAAPDYTKFRCVFLSTPKRPLCSSNSSLSSSMYSWWRASRSSGVGFCFFSTFIGRPTAEKSRTLSSSAVMTCRTDEGISVAVCVSVQLFIRLLITKTPCSL